MSMNYFSGAKPLKIKDPIWLCSGEVNSIKELEYSNSLILCLYCFADWWFHFTLTFAKQLGLQALKINTGADRNIIYLGSHF